MNKRMRGGVLVLAVALLLTMTACGGNDHDDDIVPNDRDTTTITVTDPATIDGVWSSPSGSLLRLDFDEGEYTFETYTGRIGSGEYGLVDGVPMMDFDGFNYRFLLRDDGVLLPDRNGSSDTAESIDRFTFRRSNDIVENWDITDLEGMWQNALGEIILIDTDRMKYCAVSPDVMSSGTLVDKNDGKGPYLTLNGYAYIYPGRDRNRFMLVFTKSDSDEPDGHFSGVFYRNGDAEDYIVPDKAQFTTDGDDNVWYSDGVDRFFLGDGYTVSDDGYAYDADGNLFAAGFAMKDYDPAEDWGEDWNVY